jgi:GNAT superfamily N-acetyltransferase
MLDASKVMILGYGDDDDPDGKIRDACHDIMQKTGIRVSNRKELLFYAFYYDSDSDEDIIVGALYSEYDHMGNYFSADFAVDEKWQGKGLGSKFIDEYIRFCKNNYVFQDFGVEDDDTDDARIEMHVVNPGIINMLTRKGFKEKSKYQNEVIMVKYL